MNKPKHIFALDALRFLAAVMVMSFHLGFWNWTKAGNYHGQFPSAYAFLTPVSQFGWVGVEMFFVLSGFVIVYSAQRATASDFLRHRFLRLFPAALLCSTITALVLLLRAQMAPRHIGLLWIKSTTFFPIGPWIDNAYWTLDVELAFYGVILFLLVRKRFDLMPKVMGWMGVVSSAFWVLASLPGQWAVSRTLHPLVSALETHESLNILLLRHGCYFSIGAFLWIVSSSPEGWTRSRAAILLVSSVGGVLQISYRAADLSGLSGYDLRPLFPVLMWLSATAALPLAVLFNEHIHAIAGVRGARLLRQMGLMTYPLYLLHQALGVQLLRLMGTRLAARQSLVLTTLVVMLIAYVVSAYMEPKLRRFFHDILFREWQRDGVLNRIPANNEPLMDRL